MTKSFASLRAGAARLTGCAALLSVFALAAPLQAQKPEARIVAPVDNTVRATLAGSRPPRLVGATDAGRMAASTAIQGASIYFSQSAAQQSALTALLAAQQDPSSPQYHQWLTPAQFGAEFGAADSDVAKVEAWLQGQGFAIVELSPNRSLIRFSGNVAQIEAAFGTEMHNYMVGTEKHFGPSSDLSVPAAFAGAVMSVANLSDFRPHSHVKMVPPVKVAANFTSSQTQSHYVTPKDVATIYDINAAYNSGWTGAGQSITAIGQSEVVTGDITNFQVAAGVPIRTPNQTLMPGTGAATPYEGDEAESDLDLEYSSAIARGATINFVYTGNSPNYGAFDAFGYAVTSKIGTIISISYGECETALGSTAYGTYNMFAQEAAAQGQSVVSAAGDNGSTDCYEDAPAASFDLTTTQEGALSVDWPASSAYVTGMGGSEYLSADVVVGNTTYWLAASGIDALSSAVSYIPEQAWNDDSTTYGLSSGGGGVSTLTTPQPSWQKGVTGITAGSFRLVPDIALASSPNNAGYLYCSSDASTDITGSCSYGFRDSSDVELTVAGGTSFAAPIFSGMLAIIGQSKGNTTGQGLVNPTLYTLASNSSTYASAFHDITTGNNACASGSTYPVTLITTGGSAAGPACGANASYAAGTGYDEATGLGSVDLNNLLTAWPGMVAAAPAKFTLSAPAATIATPGSSGTVTVTVTPVGGYTGTVNLTMTGNPLVTYACFAPVSAGVSGATAATATVTIYTSTTTCPTNAQPLSQSGSSTSAKAVTPAQPGNREPNEVPAGIAVAGLLAIGFAGRRSRRLRGVIAVAVLAIAAGFGLSGCSSGGSGTGVVGTTTTTTTTTGTSPAGTYTVTVIGQDSTTGVQATTTFSLTIQ